VKEGQTVGRTKKADIMLQGVPKLDWISGIHARVFRQGEQWYIQHLGETNFIKVDGEMYKGREEVAFYDGSIVIFSLTAFRVSLGGK
jgi:pSer/pThr/pTyr-binding forkhead associated (FHA) protein